MSHPYKTGDRVVLEGWDSLATVTDETTPDRIWVLFDGYTTSKYTEFPSKVSYYTANPYDLDLI